MTHKMNLIFQSERLLLHQESYVYDIIYPFISMTFLTHA
jgi:hypothetical protein